jgi:hypothetical protein
MAAILSQTGKTEKPTVGFQARFFLRGCGRRLSLKRNDLQCKKSQKHEKYFSGDLRFSAKDIL